MRKFVKIKFDKLILKLSKNKKCILSKLKYNLNNKYLLKMNMVICIIYIKYII